MEEPNVTSPPPTPWHRQPLWLGVLGLALMVGGWKLSTYRPGDAVLADLSRRTDDRELKGRLAQLRQPPYELSGRLLLFAGVGLFVLAGVQMYQQPAAPPRPAPPDEPADDDDYASQAMRSNSDRSR